MDMPALMARCARYRILVSRRDGSWVQDRLGLSSAPVGVPAMVDIEYVDELIGLLDAIAHPVFTASGSPLAFERLAVFTHGARPGASRRSSTPNLYSEPSPISKSANRHASVGKLSLFSVLFVSSVTCSTPPSRRLLFSKLLLSMSRDRAPLARRVVTIPLTGSGLRARPQLVRVPVQSTRSLSSSRAASGTRHSEREDVPSRQDNSSHILSQGHSTPQCNCNNPLASGCKRAWNR